MEKLTNLSTLRRLCEKYDFKFSKGYGQNFLVNPSICPRICEAAGIGPGSEVFEIGPGFGTLTAELAARAGRVLCLEKDPHLLPVLAETLADFNNVTVLEADALKADLAALFAAHLSGPVTVCANLPYNITSPVLMRLLEEDLPIESITVMVQKEAAQRITTPPGSREAGAISYAVRYYAQPTLCFTVKPGSFYPPPKVTSAVIRLDVKRGQAESPDERRRLFALIRAAFGQRRKTLANAASAGLRLPKEQLAAALERAGLPPLSRPEQLTLEDYRRLAKILHKTGELQ